MQVEAPRVVRIGIAIKVNEVLDVATEAILSGDRVALLEVIDDLVVELVYCVDVSALRYELEVVD